ncbi:Acetyl-CoA synthetase-like protein [Mycena venus]|uniref:Acetyl-CoA synthetase-like protein n=1 Tax=Mycena venus TaxID=2733690 RepID=A0A8H6XVH9_9AGAR|nr:Acetyl-CoA synthetase-like protein [Mycena venus]
MSNFLPPLDCSLDLGEIINWHIAHNNHSVAYSFADEDGHTTDISHFEFARAAHRVAHLLRPERRGSEGQVLAIVALTDVLIYQTIVAGCIVAGLVSFQISHRNSAAAVVHLICNTDSHHLLTTRGSLGRLVDTVSTDISTLIWVMKQSKIPLFYTQARLPQQQSTTSPCTFIPVVGFQLSNSLLKEMDLHPSGSTGFPKCIPGTHRSLIHYAALGQHLICSFAVFSADPFADPSVQFKELSPRQAVGALPPAHGLGMITQLLAPILNGVTACIYPPASTATEYIVPVSTTPENAIENAKRAKATGIMAVPSFILEWQSPEDIAYLKTLNLLGYAGGPLASRVGNFLFNQGVNLVPVYGATECEFSLSCKPTKIHLCFPSSVGVPSVIKMRQAEVDAGEWAWFRFSGRTNIRWVPQGRWDVRVPILSAFTVPETHQVSVENLPDVKGYSTKDLFERHPTQPDLYKIVGRLDDVLIMANGEKTVPGPMEDIMMASPHIVGAVMFGRERNQVGVLIEPNLQHKIDPKDEQQIAKFRSLIWPMVEDANKNAPAFARIYKEMILKATIASYTQDIDELYDTIEASTNAASDVEPPSSWTSKNLGPWLKTHATLVAHKDIHGGHDLFDQGLDSLNATFLRHRIVGALKNSSDDAAKAAAQKIPQNFVYAYPSIEELADAIALLVQDDANGLDNGKKALVEAMIAKYSEGFKPTDLRKRVVSFGETVVLLTGSTGGLGSHILEILLALSSVERVYAFNRRGRSPVPERQNEAFIGHALNMDLLSSKKLVYLEGDTAREDLGLPLDVWATVRDTITVIIHNAWTLDFNKSLSSFEPHVKGTRNLIDLARQSPNESGVRFLFTSSIGSALGWDRNLGPFPEELQLNADIAVGSGYGESKYISERILAASGLDATSFRIGQICGSTKNGAWSTTDWVPAIVKSSIALGNFPSDPSGVATWLPPEAVSRAIVDAALSAEKPPFAINLVHPRPVPWNSLMSAMASTVRLPLVPFADWVQQLQDRSSRATAEDMEKMPGLKLLDFFKGALSGAGNVEFATVKAQAMSESVKLLDPLNEDDAKKWMHYWMEKKFIT